MVEKNIQRRGILPIPRSNIQGRGQEGEPAINAGQLYLLGLQILQNNARLNARTLDKIVPKSVEFQGLLPNGSVDSIVIKQTYDQSESISLTHQVAQTDGTKHDKTILIGSDGTVMMAETTDYIQDGTPKDPVVISDIQELESVINGFTLNLVAIRDGFLGEPTNMEEGEVPESLAAA